MKVAAGLLFGLCLIFVLPLLCFVGLLNCFGCLVVVC